MVASLNLLPNLNLILNVYNSHNFMYYLPSKVLLTDPCWVIISEEICNDTVKICNSIIGHISFLLNNKLIKNN